MKIEMDFKEFLDKFVFKASHPLIESAKQREESLKAILIENELNAGKTVVIPTGKTVVIPTDKKIEE